MKKYFKLLPLFLVIGLMMQSCKEEFNIPTAEETTPAVKKAARMNQNSYAQLLDDLDNLDLSYGFSSVSTISAYEDWDFTDVGGSWSIAAEDAKGACSGAVAGATLSGGNLVAAGIAGVVVGAICSVAEYKKENNENNNDNMQIAINPTRPFAYDQYENRFYYGGWAPIGSEIGDLHNSMVSELLAEIDSSNCISTLSDIFEYAYSTNFSTLSTHYTPQQILGVQAYLNTYETDILSDLEDDEMTTLWQDYPDEMEVIKHYAFVLTQTTTFFDRFQYTMDFMTNVHLAYQSELISEESALMINGTISTFYCSKTAWNYIQPDPFFANEFIVCGNNTWYLTDSQSKLQLLLLGSNPGINFIGYPYISNDTIKRIYVYADSPLNATLQNNNTFISLFNNTTFTNAITTVSVIDNYRNCASIATGNYPIYPAAGYEDYVFIDLEE